MEETGRVGQQGARREPLGMAEGVRDSWRQRVGDFMGSAEAQGSRRGAPSIYSSLLISSLLGWKGLSAEQFIAQLLTVHFLD